MPNHTYATLIVGAGFTGSARRSNWPKPVSTTSSSSSAVTVSAEPGATPGIRVPAVTSPRCCTRFRSSTTPTWSRTYSPAAEICQHIEDTATQFDIRRHIRFGSQVNGLTFDEITGVWTATTVAGQSFRARTAILATRTAYRRPGNTGSTTWLAWPAPPPATSGCIVTALPHVDAISEMLVRADVEHVADRIKPALRL